MDEYLKIWQKLVVSRTFELEAVAAHKRKLFPSPIYLSIGQEFVPAVASVVLSKDDWNLFPQHRGHSWYLSYGGDPGQLIDELLGLPTGCARGMGGSASLQYPSKRIYGHSGLLGDQVPIAAGMALGSDQPTLVVMGDAAAEEDYVLATLGFAITKKIPILFVVEDNGLSILTKTEVRRSWDIVKVAAGFGIQSIWCDNTLDLIAKLRRLLNLNYEVDRNSLPALINVKVERHYWHAGSGQDGPPTTDEYVSFRKFVVEMFSEKQVHDIEIENQNEIKALWASKCSH